MSRNEEQVVANNVDNITDGHKKSAGLLPVMEIFGPTMQGEGFFAGRRSYFVRFGGCSYRCSWCDSMHAVDPEAVKNNAEWLSPEEILARLRGLVEEDQLRTELIPLKEPILRPSNLVTLSGGDPCMWDLSKVIHQLHNKNWAVAIETQGAIIPDWIRVVDHVTVSPKPPSSGMDHRLDLEKLRKLNASCKPGAGPMYKIVIDGNNGDDWAFAERIAKEVAFHKRVFLSALTPPMHPETVLAMRKAGLQDDEIEDIVTISVASSYRCMVLNSFKYPHLSYNATLLPQLHVLVWGHAKGV